MNDAYEKFAYDYDEFGDIKDYLGPEKEFFEIVFKENNVNTVLDCACGTGHHIYMMDKMGLEVSGSDYSNSMLEVAKNNLSDLNKDIKLKQCDFRYLENAFDEKFDAIVCLTTSLPHLHEDDDLITALKSMKNRLNDSGILVLTQGATPATLKLPPIEVVVEREDFTRVYVKEYDDRFQTIHILDLYHSKDRLENQQYDVKYRLLFDEDYKELLSKAGFTEINFYGDYYRSPYTKDSRRLIIVAK